MEQEERSLNFIEQIVEKDLAEGVNDGRIQTRFPPEPNGYLHIGHVKAICMDFGIAEKYNGVCNLRFDDTNPAKEDTEYVETIERDIRWLGFKWGQIYYASDYFQQLYDLAIMFIKAGKAYVDEQTAEQIAEQKGTPTEPGVASPYRDRPIEENLRLFDSSIMLSDVDNYVDQEFDTVNGELFVKAYVPPIKERPERRSRAGKAQKKLNRFDRMIDGEFNFHYTTDQFQKMVTLFKPEDIVDISVKQHGTSIVIGKLHVKQPIKLSFFKRMFNKFVDWSGWFKSHRITDYEIVYGPVYSSRTQIRNKYINNDVNGGYYGEDIWSEYGDIIYPYLDEGMTVYGEICGYLTNTETPIQKTYDYGCDKGENTIMFYRITTTNEDGSKREWEVQEVFEWTEKLKERMYQNDDPLNALRIQPINLLYHGTLEDLYPDLDPDNHWVVNLLDRMKDDKERFGMEENEPLCTHHQVPREGICIRKCGSTKPACYKLKTDAFFLGESVRMDAGEVDIEMADNYGDEPETV